MNKSLEHRLVFYFLLSILFNLLNLLNDLQEDSIGVALQEQMVAFPLTFCFVIGIYYFQRWLHTRAFFKWLSLRTGLSDFWVWSFMMLPISLALGIVFRVISLVVFNDDESDVIFDLLFLAISIAIFVGGTFVYLLEGYLELEIAEKQFSLKIMEMENEKTLAQYHILKNQLNPHFLFNSFNTLINLIYLSPEKAEQFVHELSNIYRYNLEQGEELVVTLEKEVRLIHAYIDLNQIRYVNSINFECTIESDVLKRLLPPMTLMLLVENALKHNYFDAAHPISIRIWTQDQYMWVTNTFRPRKSSNRMASLGIGQKNLVNQYGILEATTPVFFTENGLYTAKIPLIEPDL